MIVYGGSGHAKVIIEILERMGVEKIQVWDDSPAGDMLLGYPLSKPAIQDQGKEVEIVVAIGRNDIRKRIAEKCQLYAKFATAIEPTAQVSKRSVVGEGTVIMAGAVINSSSSIGRHCIVNTSATIDHDCTVANYVHISPNATLCGGVSVGEETHIGAGSVVIEGKKIGKCCIIGAGTVVINDVPDYATVVGNPGRIIKLREKIL